MLSQVVGVGVPPLEAAGDRVLALAGPVVSATRGPGARPGSLRLGPEQTSVAVPVALAERVAAAIARPSPRRSWPSAERLANVAGRPQRVRVAVGAFGVHVDEPHLHGAERTRQLAVAAVPLVAQPGVLADLKISSGQTSSRPNPRPNVWKPIDSSATLPVKTSRSAHEIARPYFCLTGQSSRRAHRGSRCPASC